MFALGDYTVIPCGQSKGSLQQDKKICGKAVEVLFPLQRREGNGLSRISNYLSFSFRKTCNTALWQKAFSFPSSMGHCAAPLQHLSFQGSAARRFHLTSDTHCHCSLPWGRWCLGENTGQALSVTASWANLCPWHCVKLCHNIPAPLLPPKVRGQELRDCCGMCRALLWDLLWFLQHF